MVIDCLRCYPRLRINFFARIHVVECLDFYSKEEPLCQIIINTGNKASTPGKSFAFSGVAGRYYFSVAIQSSITIINFEVGVGAVELNTSIWVNSGEATLK